MGASEHPQLQSELTPLRGLSTGDAPHPSEPIPRASWGPASLCHSVAPWPSCDSWECMLDLCCAD